MSIVVRRIHPDDVMALKSVRLAALLDSPSAFASSYEKERDRSDDEWRARAEQGSSGDSSITFLAWLEDNAGRQSGSTNPTDVQSIEQTADRPVGLVSAFVSGPTTDVELVSMWTSPIVRGKGVGRSLVDAVLLWAAQIEAQSVNLWVTTGNQAAEGLYESMGFAQTGDHQPLPSDPCKDETRMTRPA